MLCFFDVLLQYEPFSYRLGNNSRKRVTRRGVGLKAAGTIESAAGSKTSPKGSDQSTTPDAGFVYSTEKTGISEQ